MIGPVFGIVGFLGATISPDSAAARRLTACSMAQASPSLSGCSAPSSASPSPDFLGRPIGETSPVLNSSPLCRLNL